MLFQNVAVPDSAMFHDFAHLFPMMSTTAHKDLVADIKKHGLLHPLVRHEGKIIDGRNRWLACQELGIEPRVEDLPEGVNPLDYVVSTNYTRRHLSESQRALAAARIIGHNVGRDSAKATFKVTSAAIKQAEIVLRNGIAGLVDAVEHDKIPVGLAAKLAVLPLRVQEEALTLKVADLRGVLKKQQRIKQSRKLVESTSLASEKLGHTVYGVIYADPPWKHDLSSGGNNLSETASLKEMAIPAADNCILYLWAPVPMLETALDVMHAWGFSYKSQFVWVKDKFGSGTWNRNRHELLLVGTKGSVPAPDPSQRADSVFLEPANDQDKPDSIMMMVENSYPNLPRLELFARHEPENSTQQDDEAGPDRADVDAAFEETSAAAD